MAIGPPGRPRDPIHVIPMALALALAAFAGGALGLIWHKVMGDSKPAETTGTGSPSRPRPRGQGRNLKPAHAGSRTATRRVRFLRQAVPVAPAHDSSPTVSGTAPGGEN